MHVFHAVDIFSFVFNISEKNPHEKPTGKNVLMSLLGLSCSSQITVLKCIVPPNRDGSSELVGDPQLTGMDLDNFYCTVHD